MIATKFNPCPYYVSFFCILLAGYRFESAVQKYFFLCIGQAVHHLFDAVVATNVNQVIGSRIIRMGYILNGDWVVLGVGNFADCWPNSST